MSTQLKMPSKSNQLFSNKLRCLSLGVDPFGSSINSVTSLAMLCSCLSRPLQGLVPVGGEGDSSLASNPNVCTHYKRAIFLCHFHTMERQEIDKAEG